MKSDKKTKTDKKREAKYQCLSHVYDEVDSIHDELCELERRLDEAIREGKLNRSSKFKEATQKASTTLSLAESDVYTLADTLQEQVDELFEKLPCR